MEENNNGKAKPIQPNNNISLDERATKHQALHPNDNSTTLIRSKRIDITERSVKITETKGIKRIKRQGLGTATWGRPAMTAAQKAKAKKSDLVDAILHEGEEE
jgi:hypothetical protein